MVNAPQTQKNLATARFRYTRQSHPRLQARRVSRTTNRGTLDRYFHTSAPKAPTALWLGPQPDKPLSTVWVGLQPDTPPTVARPSARQAPQYSVARSSARQAPQYSVGRASARQRRRWTAIPPGRTKVRPTTRRALSIAAPTAPAQPTTRHPSRGEATSILTPGGELGATEDVPFQSGRKHVAAKTAKHFEPH